MTKQTILLAVGFSLGIMASAQSYFDQNISPGVGFASDVNGRPLYLKTEYNADGSPYLYEEYCMAEITAMNGKVYNNIKAKINLQDKLLLFTADNGQEMIMTSPIKKIKFFNYVSNGVAYPERTFQGHLTALNAEGAGIYEVLAEDSAATLLKLTTVNFHDSKGYGDATITRTFKKIETYFAAIPSKSKELRKVERNKSGVAELFGNKSAAV
ncbi:MAG: hypothetical protein EOO04_21755, partial [Chitinophagaceae bacterium]